MSECACCHNDLDPANIIVVDGRDAGGCGSSSGSGSSSSEMSPRAYLIDYEWSGLGDRVCDLATFCLLAGLDAAGEDRVLRAYFGDRGVSPLHRARLRLWRLWFAVRGALWSAVKGASTRGGAAAVAGEGNGNMQATPSAASTSSPCDYAAYAEEGWATFAEGVGTPAVAAAMQLIEEHLGNDLASTSEE